jgi:hypothetical protein
MNEIISRASSNWGFPIGVRHVGEEVSSIEKSLVIDMNILTICSIGGSNFWKSTFKRSRAF